VWHKDVIQTGQKAPHEEQSRDNGQRA